MSVHVTVFLLVMNQMDFGFVHSQKRKLSLRLYFVQIENNTESIYKG